MRTLKIIVVAVILTATAPAQAGAAVCYGTDQTPQGLNTDLEYFAHWNSTGHGRNSERLAREEWSEDYWGSPSCTTSQDLESGFLVIIETQVRAYNGEDLVTMGAGFGRTQGEAEDEAVRELRRRNGAWQERHGYSVRLNQRF